MNPPDYAQHASLRDRMATLMIATYCAIRRSNPYATVEEVETETDRVLRLWLTECR